LPEFIRQGRDVGMAKSGDAVASSGLSVLVSALRMLQSFPGILVSSQMILFSLLRRDTMGMRGDVMQFGGSLVILVMRSAVITSGHT